VSVARKAVMWPALAGAATADMKRALELWLFTTTLTLLGVLAVIVVAMLSMTYLPAGLLPYILVAVVAALGVGIARLVRRHI
jgi:hypothetical protein